MIREDRFLISRRPYAVDLGSLRHGVRQAGANYVWCTARAVWFRRRRGATVACVGVLSTPIEDPTPETAEDFLRRYTDGRYGGETHGRWDGENYWGAQKPDVIEEHLALLRPMLKNYPAVPDGFDGWWRF